MTTDAKRAKSLANLKMFSPGQSGNPGGRPKLPEDIRTARTMTDVELIRLLNKFLGMTKEELKEHLANPKATMLEVTIGSIVAKAATGADHQRFDFLLTRMIGKVREAPQEHVVNFSSMPREKIIEMGKDAIRFLEAKKDE